VPALIVSDPFLSAAAFAAEALNVLAGRVARRSAAGEETLLPIQTDLGRAGQQRLERLKQRLGLQGVNFAAGATPSVQSPTLHISYFSRTWYQADPDFLPQTRFVGGTVTLSQTPPPDWLGLSCRKRRWPW
jgi:hypothetical protein